MKMQALDSTIKSIYVAKSILVNDGVETLRRYGLVHAVLDIRSWSIIRCRRFFKPQFDVQSRPGDRHSFNARSSASNAPKKRRSRGKGRKAHGLPPDPILPKQNLSQNKVQRNIKSSRMTLMSSLL